MMTITDELAKKLPVSAASETERVPLELWRVDVKLRVVKKYKFVSY